MLGPLAWCPMDALRQSESLTSEVLAERTKKNADTVALSWACLTSSCIICGVEWKFLGIWEEKNVRKQHFLAISSLLSSFRATLTLETVKADKALVLGIVRREEIKSHANKCWQSTGLCFLFHGLDLASCLTRFEICYWSDLICDTRFMASLKLPRNSTSLTLCQH